MQEHAGGELCGAGGRLSVIPRPGLRGSEEQGEGSSDSQGTLARRPSTFLIKSADLLLKTRC